jgi:hypothetical protein
MFSCISLVVRSFVSCLRAVRVGASTRLTASVVTPCCAAWPSAARVCSTSFDRARACAASLLMALPSCTAVLHVASAARSCAATQSLYCVYVAMLAGRVERLVY